MNELLVVQLVAVGVAILFLGIAIGRILGAKQYDKIIDVYHEICDDWNRIYLQGMADWKEMYKNSSNDYINEMKSHTETIIKFTKEQEEWKKNLEK